MRTFRIYEGDALAVLKGLPGESVQTCVTSPPYFGLRDYGVEGQIGLEETPELFIARLVSIFAEVRRVLRADGTLWVNLGDTYAGNRGNTSEKPGYDNKARKGGAGIAVGHKRLPSLPTKRVANARSMTPSRRRDKEPVPRADIRVPGFKPKDLIGIPWMVAFALRADGWYLRSDIIWHKPNPMPESVTDRPTRAHEYIFLLSKSERYFYDAEAVREDAKYGRCGWTENAYGQLRSVAPGDGRENQRGSHAVGNNPTTGRNRRSVWTVATHPFAEAHFATFPPALIEPCILAGSKEGDTVLDPFTGSGTSGLVALRLNRNFVGAELNPEYAAMARRRIYNDAPLLNREAA